MDECLRFIMEYFKDEDGSKMNIPSNFNHYAAGNAHKIIQECYESSKITFEEILKTYEWDKSTGITNHLKKILEYATYPEKYLEGQVSITCILTDSEGGDDGMKIMIPGPDHLWDSMFHILYLVYYAIKETKLYHLNYKETDDILEIILNGYDKTKICGLASGIRGQLPYGAIREELNDMVHCRDKKEPISYQRKDEYKGEWTTEILNKARHRMVEIIKKYPKLRELLDEKEDMGRRYEIDLLYQMNKMLEKITSMNEDKLHKIEVEIHQAGGTAQYVMKNEIGYKIDYWIKEAKSELFDELVDQKKENGWGVTWKQRRLLGVDKLNKKCEERTLEKIRFYHEEEKRNIRMIPNKLKIHQPEPERLGDAFERIQLEQVLAATERSGGKVS